MAHPASHHGLWDHLWHGKSRWSAAHSFHLQRSAYWLWDYPLLSYLCHTPAVGSWALVFLWSFSACCMPPWQLCLAAVIKDSEMHCYCMRDRQWYPKVPSRGLETHKCHPITICHHSSGSIHQSRRICENCPLRTQPMRELIPTHLTYRSSIKIRESWKAQQIKYPSFTPKLYCCPKLLRIKNLLLLNIFFHVRKPIILSNVTAEFVFVQKIQASC